MCKNDKISFSVNLCNLNRVQLMILNDIFRLYSVVGTCWALYLIFSGFFFNYYSLFYDFEDVPYSIFIMEYILEFLCMILLVCLFADLLTLPIASMVLLCCKIEILCEEFKKLEYHSEKQFVEIISKLVDYHEYLLK